MSFLFWYRVCRSFYESVPGFLCGEFILGIKVRSRVGYIAVHFGFGMMVGSYACINWCIIVPIFIVGIICGEKV